MVGETVAEYRLEAVVGHGGMGTVYRATDTGLDKTVAIKMLSAHLAEDPSFMGRFRAEARALARLDDPAIVRVHALRESVKGVFIVMEYVEGEPLGTYLDQHGPLAPGEAVALFLPVLRAVGHAHEAGVLHRDLKPSNLIVPDGFAPGAAEGPPVKITDFGLAKIRSADTQLTATGETAGTAGYMAPEQIEGLREADERSDLFAVGMMLYEALAGRPPFDREQTAFAVQRHVVEEPFSPPTAFADVPDGLSAAVMKALAKDPAERVQSADVLHAALAPFAVGSAASPTPAVSSSEEREAASHSVWLSSSTSLPDSPWFSDSSTTKTALLFVLACAVLGGVLWGAGAFLPAPSSSDPAAAERSAGGSGTSGPAAEAPALTRLSVRSVPGGATVYLNGDSAGTTPLEGAAVEPGSVRVRMQKPGFADFDTTLTATSGSRTNFTMRFAPAGDEEPPSQASAPETTEPRSSHRAAGPSETPPPERAAVLKVRLEPSGTLAIDGEVVQHNSDTLHTDTLAPGTHTLTLTHPELGEREVRVSLPPGETRERTIDLRETKRVRITARTPDGEDVPAAAVVVDGELRKNTTTPGPFELRLGYRTIEVRKSGYVSSERTVEIHDDLSGSVVFTLQREE